MPDEISRREFLEKAGVILGSGLIAGKTESCSAPEVSEREVLFEDDFESPDYTWSHWHRIHDADYRIEGGLLHIKGKGKESSLRVGSFDWRNYRIDVDTMSTKDWGSRVEFRVHSDWILNAFISIPDRFIAISERGVGFLNQYTKNLSHNTWYHLAVEVSGNNIKVYLGEGKGTTNLKKIIDYTYAHMPLELAKGRVGLNVGGSGDSYFDNFRVTKLPDSKFPKPEISLPFKDDFSDPEYTFSHWRHWYVAEPFIKDGKLHLGAHPERGYLGKGLSVIRALRFCNLHGQEKDWRDYQVDFDMCFLKGNHARLFFRMFDDEHSYHVGIWPDRLEIYEWALGVHRVIAGPTDVSIGNKWHHYTLRVSGTQLSKGGKAVDVEFYLDGKKVLEGKDTEGKWYLSYGGTGIGTLRSHIVVDNFVVTKK